MHVSMGAAEEFSEPQGHRIWTAARVTERQNTRNGAAYEDAIGDSKPTVGEVSRKVGYSLKKGAAMAAFRPQDAAKAASKQVCAAHGSKKGELSIASPRNEDPLEESKIRKRGASYASRK